MRTSRLLSFSISAFAIPSVATLAAAPNGVVYVGDGASVDRALLSTEALDASPPVAPRAGGYGITPAGYSESMRPSTTDPAAAPRSGGLFGKLKSAWSFGEADSTPAVDPFAQAQQSARVAALGPRGVVRDPGVRPIPTFDPSTQGRPVAAAYENSVPQAGRSGPGIAMRKDSGPRRGLFSGLFGSGEASAAPQPARTPQQTYARPPQQPIAQATRPAAAAPQPTRQTAAPQRLSAPSLGLSSKPYVEQTPYVQRSPSPRTAAPQPVAPQQPAEMVMVSDDAPAPLSPVTTTPKPMAAKPRPAAERLAEVVTPDLATPLPQSPTQLALSPTQLPQSPTPRAGRPAALKLPPVAAAVPAPAPREVASAPQQASTPKPIPVVPPAAIAPFPSTAPQVSAQSKVRTEEQAPSERSRELLAEAHALAAKAASPEDFAAVVQRCRYVLAIDPSVTAQRYANELAAWGLCKRGSALDDAGRHAEAETDYHDAIACDSQCWRAEHALGVIAASAGDSAAARQRFDRTIDLNPEFAKAYSNRAALAVQGGDYRAALDDYARAIAIDPDLAIAHTGRGRVCHMLGMLEEGLRHLDAAEVLDPQDATASAGRGDLLTDLGRYGQAMAAYERAIQTAPRSPIAYRNLAWLQATCPVTSFRNGQSALENAELAEKLAGSADDLTLDTKAAALAALGRFDEASQTQRQAIELAPPADGVAYRERLALYERGQAFSSQPVGVRQATYLK